jgi:hypothetical protein
MSSNLACGDTARRLDEAREEIMDTLERAQDAFLALSSS